jgi:D-amino-acid dehydrogenase
MGSMKPNATGTEKRKVVVIGGGVIGAMCAWYLNQANFDVTILDRGRLGGGCSHGNCGYVSPSHILPLAKPGAVVDALQSLFRRNSPLKVRFRWSPALWHWFLQFARRCNQRDMIDSGEGLHVLLQSSRNLFQELVRQNRLECEWQEQGLLFVFRDRQRWEHYSAVNELLNRQFGVSAEKIDGDKLVQMEPALKPGLAGAWYYRGDCHLRPDLLMRSMGELLASRGVRIQEQCRVDRFLVERNVCRSVVAGERRFDADCFVLATGAWTPQFNRQLDCKIPIQPGKGYSLTMPHPRQVPRIPLIFEQHRVAVTPLRDKYRIGSTMEFAGYDASLNRSRLSLLKSAAEIYLHAPYCEPIEEEWFGWRPMTWDGKPIIDRSPGIENMWIAAGHNMLGVSLATGTGKLIAEMITGRPPHVPHSHFAVSRFVK